jgi:hypothetical protein
MDNENLIATLKQIKALAEQALNDGGTKKSRTPKPAKADVAPKQSAPETLPDHIIRLRDEGFFKQPQTAKEVHTKLQSSYHCETNRVAMSLLRLLEKKELRKISKTAVGKKQIAYVW